MSFWNTSTGESAYTNETSYDAGGGNFEPLPEGSNVLATIDSVKWEKVFEGHEEYINIQWTIIEPEEHRNRKIFQKLWVADLDPNAKDNEDGQRKRNLALRRFAVIDANAGGRLAKLTDAPTDDELMLSLAGKVMVIGLSVWEFNGKRGNWVSSVYDKSAPLNVPDDAPSKNKSSRQVDDDIVPF